MPTTVMLCRWNGGWLEVAHPNVTTLGRKEAYLSVGAAQTEGEAYALGFGQLNLFAQTREGVTIETDPADSALPYFTYNNGDTISVADSNLVLQNSLITSISMTEDEDGEILWTPEAGDLVIGEDELFVGLESAVQTGLARPPTPPAPSRIHPSK